MVDEYLDIVYLFVLNERRFYLISVNHFATATVYYQSELLRIYTYL